MQDHQIDPIGIIEDRGVVDADGVVKDINQKDTLEYLYPGGAIEGELIPVIGWIIWRRPILEIGIHVL